MGFYPFDKNHDLLSGGVFIFQAKRLIKYYLKMWMQRVNTWQGFLWVCGEKAAPDESYVCWHSNIRFDTCLVSCMRIISRANKLHGVCFLNPEILRGSLLLMQYFKKYRIVTQHCKKNLICYQCWPYWRCLLAWGFSNVLVWAVQSWGPVPCCRAASAVPVGTRGCSDLALQQISITSLLSFSSTCSLKKSVVSVWLMDF